MTAAGLAVYSAGLLAAMYAGFLHILVLYTCARWRCWGRGRDSPRCWLLGCRDPLYLAVYTVSAASAVLTVAVLYWVAATGACVPAAATPAAVLTAAALALHAARLADAGGADLADLTVLLALALQLAAALYAAGVRVEFNVHHTTLCR